MLGRNKTFKFYFSSGQAYQANRYVHLHLLMHCLNNKTKKKQIKSKNTSPQEHFQNSIEKSLTGKIDTSSTFSRVGAVISKNGVFEKGEVNQLLWAQAQRRIQVGAPPKIGKKYDFFWRKIVIFHTKYPKYFRAFLRSAQFF